MDYLLLLVKQGQNCVSPFFRLKKSMIFKNTGSNPVSVLPSDSWASQEATITCTRHPIAQTDFRDRPSELRMLHNGASYLFCRDEL
jgi:hypothetical protein